MTSSDRECDDLTAIKGISPERQRKLRKFGIRTLQDLAEISDDKIEAAAAEIKGVSVNMIKKWRTEARERLSSQQAIKPPELEGEDTANSPATEGEWKSTDVFIVQSQVLEVEGRTEKQQVIAEHIEVRDGTWMDKVTGETQEVKDEELCRWVRKKLGDRMRRMPELEKELPVEAQPAAAPPAATPPVKVEVAQICAFQPPQAETPIAIGRAGQPFSGFVRSGEPFALKASFGLVVPAAAQVAKKQVTYRAQFYARNLSTSERIHLGDTKPDPLIESKLSYAATLPVAALQPGMYRLWALVTLQSTPPNVGYLEMPLLQVV
jgi:hypothetical protein